MKKELPNLNFPEMEKTMLEKWQTGDYFKKLVKKNENSPKRFKFLDGPATANNRLGVHHFWGRTLKDINIRYHSMLGESQQYQNGFDAQGLWVEVNIEKELGLNGKPEIVNYGIDKFTNKCMERVKYFGEQITEQSKRMGQWMDWENSYYTNTDENITSIWHFLKICNEKGWIIKKKRPVVWCPRCGTSLSAHEMADSYSEVTHTAIYLKLPVIGKDFKMVAWTTTPWTLSANVALAVNPDLDYVLARVKSTGEKLVMGASNVHKILKGDCEILDTFKGSRLVGLTYEATFPELPEQNFTHRVVAWEDVAEGDGSGVVHIAPGCGAEDFELGLKENLKQICPIDDQGVMLENTGFLARYKTTDVVDLVVNRLKQDNKLLYAHPHKHSYAHCWRCKTDIVYKLVDTWYIDMNEIRPMALKAIEEVEFQPTYAKKRMQDWLQNMGDWNISRSRFYGLPLPFYVCEKCGKLHVVGSKEELKELAIEKDKVDALPNIHRPWIDDIHIKCECGETLSRVPEVGDVWLDAGITPFSTKKYFTDREYFENNFPSDYVCEMIEQIKLWFYSLLIMSVVITGKAPYKQVCTYQYVKDENGGAFHKSGGNSLDADHVADKEGADPIRYLYAGANPNNEMRFGVTLLEETRRKLMGFWSIYSFFSTYASIDNPKLSGYTPNFTRMNITDKWLLQRVNEFINASKQNYDEHKQYEVVSDFETLIDDISNFYIRANRKRFWKSGTDDQMDAYFSLYHAIKAICKVMAPIIPFITDYMWHNMVRDLEPNEAESVHLSAFPTSVCDVNFDNVSKEADMAREVIYLAQKLRNEYQIKVKQPLRTLYLFAEDAYDTAVDNFSEIVKDELNVKEIRYVSDGNRFNDTSLKLNFKVAGAILKGEVNKVKTMLETMPQTDMNLLVEQYKQGKVTLQGFGEFDSDMFTLALTPKKEFAVAHIGTNLVALDINLDQELINEGLLRELNRSLQLMRKEAGFELTDRIVLDFSETSPEILTLLAQNANKIKQEVLAVDITTLTEFDIAKCVEIGEDTVCVKMKKSIK